jgi:limonene-1,2-epoxide hydrolase
MHKEPTMTDSPRIALAKRAIAAWEDIDWFIEHIGELCTDDLEWFNSGLGTTRGLEEARRMLRGFKKGFKGISRSSKSMTASGASGSIT